MRERLKQAKKRKRVFLRRLDKEWWEERIREFKEVCSRNRVGEMYVIGKEVGKISWKRSPASSRISVEQFKERFDGVR